MNPSIITLAQTALDRCGVYLRTGDLSEHFACWLACATLAAEWGEAHPSFFLGNPHYFGGVGDINEGNIAWYAYNWARRAQPGEWDCDGFFCSESVFQDWLEELESRIRNSLLQV